MQSLRAEFRAQWPPCVAHEKTSTKAHEELSQRESQQQQEEEERWKLFKKCDRNWDGCREEQDAFSFRDVMQQESKQIYKWELMLCTQGWFAQICSQGFQHVHYRFWIRITVTRLLAEVKEKSWSNKPVLFHLGAAAAAGGDDERHRRWTNNDPARSQPHGAIDHNLSTNILWILAASRRLCHYYAIPCLFSPSLVIDWILCQWPSQWKL